MADVNCDHTTQENFDRAKVNEAESHEKLNGSSKSVLKLRLHPASMAYVEVMAEPDIFLGTFRMPIVGPVVEVEEKDLLSCTDQAYSKFCEILSLTCMTSSYRDMVVRSGVSNASALIQRARKIEPTKELPGLIWCLRLSCVYRVELPTEEVCMIPASNSAIEALEGGTLRDFVLENTCEELSCIICMEELDAESLVTRLPCKHIFHSQCITQWLNTSHYCPLCRFEIP